MRAVIIGGGIGGLTAAAALRRAGMEAEVYERAPEPREVGAGIGLWGNAVGALRQIGLAEAVLARGERMRVAAFLTSTGRRLVETDAAAFERAGTEPVALVHRAELLEVLLGALPAETVRFGRTFARYNDDAHGVTAVFNDGSAARGDVLIGADGLHSAVRRQLLGDEAPRYAGYTCWRGVVEFPDASVPAGYVGEIWGRGRRFGITRIGRGRVYWWATLNGPPSPLEQGALDETAKAVLLRSHGAFCAPVPELIARTEPGRILRNDIYDRRPRRDWARGRALLIGDAAHPTTPNLGQGGCMAIEDGVVLASFLGRAGAGGRGPVEAALRAFVEFRWKKTARVVRESRQFGWVGQWSSPVLCRGRNAVMSVVAPVSFMRAVREIGRFEGPQGEYAEERPERTGAASGARG